MGRSKNINMNFYLLKKNTSIKKFNINFENYRKKNKDADYAVALDEKQNLKGILSLGDLRRILARKNKKSGIYEYLNRSPIFVYDFELNNNLINIINKKKKIKKINHIDVIVILSKNKKFLNLLSIEEVYKNVNYSKTCIIGAGHIGLPLLVHILKFQNSIDLFDYDIKKIDELKKLNFEFYEKDFEPQFKNLLTNKKINFINNFKYLNAQTYIICIGTDYNKKIEDSNLICLFKKLANIIKRDDLIILRGTIPVGYSRQKLIKILEKFSHLKCGEDYSFVYMPERLAEGNALYELTNIPQIISGYSINCKKKGLHFANTFFEKVVVAESIEEAEIIKLISNCYRNLNFAFANEISMLCAKLNLSANSLIKKANFAYERNNIALPSLGVGGFCLPKDSELISKNKNLRVESGSFANKINFNVLKFQLKRIQRILEKNSLNEIYIIGISFKGSPETIDTRNSTSNELIKYFSKQYKIKTYDIMLNKIIKQKYKYKKLIDKNFNINKSDIIILLNNNTEYLRLIENNLKKNNTKKNKFFFDCWGIANSQTIKELNWNYICL